ncbi:hypothetical protein L1889_03820 [Paenalcaligenes niemegkensis]|uniref:hypothetical protein n=1 Tax=Paenalcaligenes niemegkensis TaxID=2895469 RepID=UPI001EE96675|nr:hypothetical protein [Paenalcaligenes niemegkensis]MCQ9615937.1 hypothetical protein [Paenalcaligenes niemegkensis]
MMSKQLDRIEATQLRIEAKLDVLLEALAEEVDDEEQAFDLDGNLLGDERNLLEPL